MMKILRYALLAVVVVLAIGLAVPYIDAGGYRDRIQEGLQQSLHRKVSIRKVRFNLLTGPGFTVEDVIIADDPAIGIEPMAYVESLDARVRIGTLWTRNLSFSNLRLNNPTLNLAKSDAGVWNFQLLLRQGSTVQPASSGAEFPSIQVRSGRINFKFGDYKTILYLTDADMDIDPIGADRLDIRFNGQPARTDQASQYFGRLLARGIWKRASGAGPGGIEANVELERSRISDIARIVEGHGIGLHGIVSSRAKVSGTFSRLNVSGQLHLEEVHRPDLLPMQGGTLDLHYQGSADLIAQRIELETDRKQNPSLPFAVRLRASEYLSEPKWAAAFELKDAPASAVLDTLRHLGVAAPEKLDVTGRVSGMIGYSRPGGAQGQFRLEESEVHIDKGAALDVRSAEFLVNGPRIHIGPATIGVGSGQTAEVQAEYDASTTALAASLSTHGMSITEFRNVAARLLGNGTVPVLEFCRQGTWRGSLRYAHKADDQEPASAPWTGSFEVHNTRLEAAGLSEPLRVTAASVEVSGNRIAVTQMKGKAGNVSFEAEYHHDRPDHPDHIRLTIPEADIAAVDQLFAPSLRRESSLLARLRLRSVPIPDWLRTRHIEGTVRIDKLTAADQTWSVPAVKLVWKGVDVTLGGIEAHQQEATFTGQISIDLKRSSAQYSLTGALEDFEFRGGTLNLEGTAESSGSGASVLTNLHATGTFNADSVTLAPDAEFRSISGTFDVAPGAKLHLTAIQAAQASDSYTGQGTTQADGKLVLELASGKRQMRVAVQNK